MTKVNRQGPSPAQASTAKTPAARPNWRALLQSGVLLRFIFLGLGIWLHAADELIISTLITDIVGDIGGIELLGWNLALYELGSILAGAAMGLQIARTGLRTGFAMSALAYAAGCTISALAPAMEVMLLGRLAQGFGGGGLVAVAFIAVEKLFDRSIWPQLFALLSAIWGVSAFLGPLIGGLFAQADWWRGAFWFFGIQAAALAAAAYIIIPAQHVTGAPDNNGSAPGAGLSSAQNGSAPGVFPARRLAVLAVSIIAIAWSGITDNLTAAIVAGCAGLAGVFAFLAIDQNRAAGHILPSAIRTRGSTARNSLVMVFCLAASTVSFAVFGPVLLRVLHQLSALETGYVIALESIGWSVAAIALANQPEHREKLIIRTGASLVLIALTGFAVTMVSGPVWLICMFAVLMGAGFGMFWSFIIRRLVEAVDEDERSIAAASIPLVQRIAYALGAAVAGLVANSAGFSGGLSAQTSQIVAIWVFVAFIPVAIIGVFAGFKMSAR
ncbi:MFS transporter [Anderseniella sp. Alg231-50]|uniref:MFS transporter n=1 Tax=Anderseniella sp. Alg231-50 TaxID=1922226 RepID=UPI00307C99F3